MIYNNKELFKDKILIGKIIECYRIEQKCPASKLIIRNGVPICSRATYIKIQEGKPISSSEVYELLIKNLNKKIVKGSVVLDFNNLKQAIYYYNYDQINVEIIKLFVALRKVKNYFYYDLIYKVLLLVYDFFFAEVSITKSEIIDLSKNSSIFEKDLRDILHYCLCGIISNQTIDNKMNLKLLLTNEYDYLPLAMHRLHTLFQSKNYIEANELIEFINSNIKLDNFVFNVNFYWNAYKISMNSRYYDLFIKLFNEKKDLIPIQRKEILIGNIVMNQLQKKNYELCINLIDEIFDVSVKRKLQFATFYLFASSQLNIVADKKYYEVDIEDCKDFSDIVMYEYFEEYSILDSFKQIRKLNIIKFNILKDYENVYHFIIDEELKKMKNQVIV